MDYISLKLQVASGWIDYVDRLMSILSENSREPRAKNARLRSYAERIVRNLIKGQQYYLRIRFQIFSCRKVRTSGIKRQFSNLRRLSVGSYRTVLRKFRFRMSARVKYRELRSQARINLKRFDEELARIIQELNHLNVQSADSGGVNEIFRL